MATPRSRAVSSIHSSARREARSVSSQGCVSKPVAHISGSSTTSVEPAPSSSRAASSMFWPASRHCGLVCRRVIFMRGKCWWGSDMSQAAVRHFSRLVAHALRWLWRCAASNQPQTTAAPEPPGVRQPVANVVQALSLQKEKSAKSGLSAAFFHARRLSRNVKIGNPDLPFCETMLTFVITAGGSPTPGLASFFSVPASGKTSPGLAFTSPGLVKTSPGLVKTSPSVENSTPSVENFTPGFVIPTRRVVTSSPGGIVGIGTKTVTEG